MDDQDPTRAAVRPTTPAVEVVPEGTGRVRPEQAIGPRLAFVVDASQSLQRISSTLLRIAGFTVESFGDPRAAVKRSIDHRPDVMVVEPRSPGFDALATMRVLCELHGENRPAVIWCTTVVPDPAQVDEGSLLGLRGVILKPFRLEALTSLALRVCREEDRERRLRELGVPADQLLTRILDQAATQLWARAEAEIAPGPPPRSLSIVRIGAPGAEVVAAVRGALRATDTVGRGPDGSLVVLLPDVDAEGAAAVAARLARVVADLDPRAAVEPVTRRPGEEPLDLLRRTHPEAAPQPD